MNISFKNGTRISLPPLVQQNYVTLPRYKKVFLIKSMRFFKMLEAFLSDNVTD